MTFRICFARHLMVAAAFYNIIIIDATALTSPIWCPSVVTLKFVSQSHPDSFWRKLTSSEPRREFALKNVSVTFQPPVTTLLLGESSSGKSTILRLISGSESPISGNVEISNDCATLRPSRPIYLDSRPSYGQNEIVEDIWSNAGAFDKSNESPNRKTLLKELSKLLKVPLQSKILDLSMSEVYLCRIGETVLESTTINSAQHMESTTPTYLDEPNVLKLPAPILLLDEWLDNETSTVVQRVQTALHELAQNGAVIVCVTHKPHLFSSRGNRQLRRVTLSRGQVLSVAETGV